MLNDQNDVAVDDVMGVGGRSEPPSPIVRDIHALSPPPPPPPPPPINTVRPSYSSPLSTATDGSENFTTISREFNALVVAGSRIRTENERNLTRIGEEMLNSNSETNPLAIVVQGSPRSVRMHEQVKKEEAESKISAWENAKIAKINNRFKREDAIIKGWESQQVQDATSRMKKVERKLEEKRVKAMEKMQNDIAKAHMKAEERRASAEAKKGIKVAKVMEITNLMRAVGRPPSKRSLF